MKIIRLAIREIAFRKLNFCSSLVAVTTAVALFVGASALLRSHQAETARTLARLEAETQSTLQKLNKQMRQSMLKLSFNMLILPEGQDPREWHLKDYASVYMPEDYVQRLATSGIVTVRHFLPSLQQKIKWPEKDRTIILVGTRDEVPNLYKTRKKPLVQPAPPGKIVLGYELHRSLQLAVGDKVQLMGRPFTVHKCHEQRGSKDDITAWISLREAQELLDKAGRINAILALECLCAGAETLPRLRQEISRILPGAKVLEMGSRALARAEARNRVGEEAKAALARERQASSQLLARRREFAALLAAAVLLASAIWIALATYGNVRERRAEVGLMFALGLPARQVLALFLVKALLTGVAGGVLGCVLGLVVGSRLAPSAWSWSALAALVDPGRLAMAVLGAPLLAVLASWVPAVIAAQQDPAVVLREEE